MHSNFFWNTWYLIFRHSKWCRLALSIGFSFHFIEFIENDSTPYPSQTSQVSMSLCVRTREREHAYIFWVSSILNHKITHYFQRLFCGYLIHEQRKLKIVKFWFFDFGNNVDQLQSSGSSKWMPYHLTPIGSDMVSNLPKRSPLSLSLW